MGRAGETTKGYSFSLYFAYRDKRTFLFAKALIGLTLGYLFSLIDLLTDFIPMLGMLDYLMLVLLLIRLFLRFILRIY
ncbi:DUF1232 domain-containing protein [Larkinella punicea]|uniref:DUF1232 domain-containing protein n=1 Tax=Larkinella punicea TaxID=2315727 RepID=A0A368JHI9_9BACT|nr:DUF1232 domain-containing protein [Larkinella punicea]